MLLRQLTPCNARTWGMRNSKQEVGRSIECVCMAPQPKLDGSSLAAAWGTWGWARGRGESEAAVDVQHQAVRSAARCMSMRPCRQLLIRRLNHEPHACLRCKRCPCAPPVLLRVGVHQQHLRHAHPAHPLQHPHHLPLRVAAATLRKNACGRAPAVCLAGYQPLYLCKQTRQRLREPCIRALQLHLPSMTV